MKKTISAMKKIFNRPNHPQGATSLLIVVALSMTLIVIIVGLTAVSIRESRQSLNTDLSNRARVAAESTARDAAQLLNQYPDLYVPNCDGSGITGYKVPLQPQDIQNLTKPVLSSASDNSTSIVCRTITSVATTQNQTINKDESTQFFTYLPTGTGVTHFRLLWGDGNTENQTITGSTFPSVWPNNVPAALELSFVWWPKTSPSISADGLPVKTTVILPRTSNADPSAINTYDPMVDCRGYNGFAAYTGFRYSCEMKVSIEGMLLNSLDPANYNIVLKVKSRYKSTPLQAQFYKSDGYADSDLVPIKSSIATIDITAKVGDLYRRITAQKPVGGNSIVEDVLYSNESVCKNMTVYDDFSRASANNCP